MRKRLIVPWLLLVLEAPVWASTPVPPLPLALTDQDWTPLQDREDSRLERSLASELRQEPKWRRLIDNGNMAVAVVDLSSPTRPRFAQVNGDHMMYAASLPKIGILLAAFDHFDSGRLKHTQEVDADLNAMIRFSNNGAATRMIDRVGGLQEVNQVLCDPRYRLYDEQRNGGIWVGKRYAKDGGRLPDPLHGISHGATVDQVSRFYYLLATGRLIDRETSGEMLDVLADPGIEHKFVKALHGLAPEARLFRKSGTWQGSHADSVLVWGPGWRRYILVGMVHDPDGEQILRKLVPAVEEVIRFGGSAPMLTRAFPSDSEQSATR